MARKTLLTEAEIRSFLKLADLKHVGDSRIEEMYREDDDAMEEGESVQDDDPAGEAGVTSEEMEMDMEMDAPDDDAPDMDMDIGAPAADAGGAKMVSIDDFMGALESALEDVLDDEVEVDMDDDEVDMDMDDEDKPGGMEMGAAADAMDDGDDDPMMEEDHGDDQDRMDEEEVVNEIARRVAARLQAKNDNAEMVDQLAERILNRLTSK